jgi:16S rRNA (guanine966-N2)-methyltransferase
MNSYPRRSKHRQSDESAERETPRPRPRRESFTPRWLRIVAGEMRGQRVQYSGDPSIRPMKDRTRESVFNLLGGDLTGTLAIDLFAGTGVLGLEAISRGATRAILLELQRPAVSTIVANAERLKIADKVEVHNVDTLRWLKYIESTAAAWQDTPWVVFCCPPYQMWESDLERLKEGLLKMYAVAPIGSMFVLETENFDIRANFPEFEWDVRLYKPATVGIAEKQPLPQ